MTGGLPEELWGSAPSAEELAGFGSAADALARQRWAQVAAVSVTVEQAAVAANRSVEQVKAALEDGDLVALASPDGPLLPAWQLRTGPAGGFVAGVAELARAFSRNPVALTLWVSRPSPDFDGRSPAQALADGDVDKVVDVARTLTAAGW